MKRVLAILAAGAATLLLAVSCGSKVDHSSPQAIVESYLNAANRGDVDAMIECLDMSDYKSEAEAIQKNAEEYAERQKDKNKTFKVDKSVSNGDWVDYEYEDERGTGYGSLQVTSVDGKWYVTVRSTGLLY